jgi:peptidoglycan/xylan/chitin deacetylase (PgdA/CDA1 family)
MGLRGVAGRIARGTGIVRGAVALRRWTGRGRLAAFCYHRVGDAGSPCVREPSLVDATAEGFEEELDALTAHFRFVSLEEVVAFVRGAGRLPPSPALLTFDDGYVEVRDVAWPILKRRGIAAALFVPTELVTARRMFWWDRLARALSRAAAPRISVEHGALRLDLDPNAPASLDRLTEVVKRTRGLEVARFVEDVERAAQAPFSAEDERAEVDASLLDWPAIRSLSDEGLAIGSHTATHRVLQTLLPEAWRAELEGSRRELEARLDKPAPAIAYPVGYRVVGNAPLRAAVAEAGYALGLTCHAGTARLDRSLDALDVPRFLAHRGLTGSDLVTYGALPSLAPRTSVDRVGTGR